MKKIFWIIVVIAVILVLWWLWQSGGISGLPQLPGVSKEDTTAKIQQDLEQINVNDVNPEFQSIDADLNNL